MSIRNTDATRYAVWRGESRTNIYRCSMRRRQLLCKLMAMSCESFVVVDGIPSTVPVGFWAFIRCWVEGTIVKGRFENEHSSASLWLFVEPEPFPPNDFIPHRFCQVLADPGGVQEVTEHYEIFWPFVLPLPALLQAGLLATDCGFLG